MRNLIGDFRFGLRILLRNPGSPSPQSWSWRSASGPHRDLFHC